MANLAQQLKEELTERAKNSESCKKYLLDWVMNEFRQGQNPVIIKCTSTSNCVSPELRERVIKEKCQHTEGYFDFIYRDGRHFIKGYNKEVDITNLPDAQRYACNGQDVSDKTLFLKNEGFRVIKYWKYGLGDIMEVTY